MNGMANEISFTGKLIVDNGYYIVQQTDLTLDQTGKHYFSDTVDLTTTPVNLYVAPSLVTYGWAWFTNLDDTDTIEIGIQEDPAYGSIFFAFIGLAPGEKCFLPLHKYSSSLAARTESGTAILEYGVFER